jgi:hypothetical protein
MKPEYCVTAARLNAAPIVTQLFVKDKIFTLLQNMHSSTKKNEIFNTESKAARDFNT